MIKYIMFIVAMLVGLVAATEPKLAGPSSYYKGVFSNFTRESPYIVVRVKYNSKTRLIVTPNSEFSRVLCKKWGISYKNYVTIMSKTPTKNNVVMLDRELDVIDDFWLTVGCQNLSLYTESEYLRINTKSVSSGLYIKPLPEQAKMNCVIAEFIRRDYYVRVDDETGYLFVSKQ